MDNYKIGYLDRCGADRQLRLAVARHFAGQHRLDKPDDWFTGWHDAEQDNYWSNRGSYQMQFNMLPWRE